MKRFLPCASALVLALLAPSPALAEFKFSFDAYLNLIVFDTNQDVTGFADEDVRDSGVLVEGEVHLKARTILDNGMEIGARLELEIDADGSVGGVTTDSGFVDEAYVYLQSPYGRLEIGSQDGIADQFGVPPPRPFRTTSVDDPEVFFLQDGTDRAYRPNGLRLRTDNFVSEDNFKIIYSTPRWFGLQAGVSYMPQPSQSVPGLSAPNGSNADRQTDIWEFGLNYDETFDNIGVRAYAVYLTGQNEAPSDATVTATSPWTSDNLDEFGAGLTLKIDAFTVGAAYRQSNARGGASLTRVLSSGSDYTAASIGGQYVMGAWTFHAQYITAETDITQTILGAGRIFTQDGDAYEFTTVYELQTGMSLALGYQNYQYDNDNPAIVRNAGTGTLDADIVYLGWNIEM